MKHFTFLKSFLLLCALVVGSNVAWADETLYYTLDGTQTWSTSGSSAYATGTDTEQEGITWNVTGNTTLSPWGIGGKNLSSVDREVYSKTPMDAAITKVELEVGAASSVTVNSLKLVVASDEDFTDIVDEASVTFEANTTLTFNPTSPLTKWDTSSYYKFVFNLTIGGSNKKVEFKSAKFYQNVSSDPSSAAAFDDTTPSISFPATTTYSQIATTATGYTGTVTYEITANTAGASISGSTVTVTQEGSVTVKATAPAVTGFAASEASYTLTVTDTRSDNGLAYTETNQEVTVGEVLDAPTLSNPNSLSVTYSSGDEEIATVDASGNVTGVAIGSTTITASFAGDETYKAGSASYTITVKKAAGVAVDGVFDFSYDDEIDYGTGLEPSSTDIKEAKTFTAGNITLTPEPTATNKYWRWWTDGTLRLYTDTKMTIAAPDGYVITNIDFVGTQNLNAITVSDGTYEAASGNKAATWTGSAQSVVLTRNSSNPFFTTVTVTYAKELTVSYADGWMSYVTPSAITFPENVDAYVVTALSPSLTREKITSAPSGTPVVLHATEGAKTYALPVAASADAPASNELNVSDGSVTGDGKIYVLTVKGGQAGFAPLKTGSTLSAGKVYIEFPTAPAKDFIGFDDDETTSINLNVNDNLNSNSPMYNLAGQKVSENYKGIVIVNGRKYINK